MNETDIVVDSEEMEQYIFENLIKRGYVTSEQELEEISDIVFDYLIHIGAIEEDEEE